MTAQPPTVSLRPMTDVEFATWREVAIRHHAAQVSRATGKELHFTTEESRAALADMLPDGLATEGMHLLVAVGELQQEIGWLWLGTARDDVSAGFVFDIIVDEAFRGRGYGRTVMVAAERFFAAEGKTRIVLEVSRGNDVARGLYESLGYLPVSMSMSKRLPAE